MLGVRAPLSDEDLNELEAWAHRALDDQDEPFTLDEMLIINNLLYVIDRLRASEMLLVTTTGQLNGLGKM
jgi:hypothetical protein